MDHVIVQRANADAVLPEGARDRIHLVSGHHEITGRRHVAVPADWKLNAVAMPIAGGIAAPIIVIFSGRGIEIAEDPAALRAGSPITFCITSAFNSGSAEGAGAAAPAREQVPRPASPYREGGPQRLRQCGLVALPQ